MNHSRFAFALVSVTPVALSLTGCASDDDAIDQDAVYAANQENGSMHTAASSGASMGSQFCCNNISGWGSTYYYQSCANTSTVYYGGGRYDTSCTVWVTTYSTNMQGVSCPGVSGTCQHVPYRP